MKMILFIAVLGFVHGCGILICCISVYPILVVGNHFGFHRAAVLRASTCQVGKTFTSKTLIEF